MWWVQPLEKRGHDGQPSGIWHLVARSDEGGGTFAGCNHDHRTPEEAGNCEAALVAVGQVTGFPHTTKAEAAALDKARGRALSKLDEDDKRALGVG